MNCRKAQATREHTWTFAVQREVMAVILDPETPGGLRLSMDCKMESSSATADDMVDQQVSLQCRSQVLARELPG